MSAKKKARDEPFADVHQIPGYIGKPLDQLRSDAPIAEGLNPGRPERDAILEFVAARRPEVSKVRTRTFLSGLPLVAARLGPGFLQRDDRARSSRRAVATLVLTVGLLSLMAPHVLSGAGPLSTSGVRFEASSAQACGLLTVAVPNLVDAPSADPFPVLDSPPPNLLSGNPGVPEVLPPGTSSSNWGPNITDENVTFGLVRTAWTDICTSPEFLQTFWNVSPAPNSLHQFWYQAGWVSGPTGVVVVEPGFLWDAGCTGNLTGVSSNGTPNEPYFVRPLEPSPAYSGAGCTYWEYWAADLTGREPIGVTGPHLLEAVTANFVHPGSHRPPSSLFGSQSSDLYLAGGGVAVAVGLILERHIRRRRPPLTPVQGFTN